jgi:hypothetical protein
MKIPAWVLSTFTREESRPCFPQVFANEDDARKVFDEAMREEWASWVPCGEDGETQLDYPGEPGEAMRQMREYWGAEFELWELSKHEIDVSLGPLGVVVEDGIVQFVVSNDTRLLTTDVLVIDYDTDGVEATYSVPQIPATEYVPRATLYDMQVKQPTGIDFADLWRRFFTEGPDRVEQEDAA